MPLRRVTSACVSSGGRLGMRCCYSKTMSLILFEGCRYARIYGGCFFFCPEQRLIPHGLRMYFLANLRTGNRRMQNMKCNRFALMGTALLSASPAHANTAVSSINGKLGSASASVDSGDGACKC